MGPELQPGSSFRISPVSAWHPTLRGHKTCIRQYPQHSSPGHGELYSGVPIWGLKDLGSVVSGILAEVWRDAAKGKHMARWVISGMPL